MDRHVSQMGSMDKRTYFQCWYFFETRSPRLGGTWEDKLELHEIGLDNLTLIKMGHYNDEIRMCPILDIKNLALSVLLNLRGEFGSEGSEVLEAIFFILTFLWYDLSKPTINVRSFWKQVQKFIS